MADISLDCGCETVAEHTLGDRLVICPRHRLRHVVTALPARQVTYMARRLDAPNPGPDAA